MLHKTGQDFLDIQLNKLLYLPGKIPRDCRGVRGAAGPGEEAGLRSHGAQELPQAGLAGYC